MAKKQSASEAAAEAAKKRRPQKKTAAAPKAGARKPATAPAKHAAPAKRAAPPARKPPAKRSRDSAQAELPIAVPAEVIEDAEIVSETPIEAAPPAALAREPEATVEVVEAPPALSDEEQELSKLYGDDLAKPAIVHSEYSDRQTADEDRPMVPEINARDERKHQWQERRDRRRQRRDERDRQRHERRDQRPPAGAPAQDARPPEPRPDRPERSNDRNDRGDQRPDHRADQRNVDQRGDQRPNSGERPQHTPRPMPVQAPIAASNGTNGASQDHDALGRVGTPLGDAAATVFAQLRNGQPLPVRQLASMMRKRNLIESDPEQVWPQLKAELLGDERSYRTLGLRPRIVYRGRDLFAPGPVAMSQTADAEASVAAALSRLAGATHRALAARIAKASGAGFERLIHAYLVAAGYKEIAWVKRVGGIAYASAIAPGIDRTVLISARSGDQPIDRRGIGELRVGVEAKNLVAGILFSARELSDDAEKELERAGRSIAVMCGDQLVAALIATGVGVVSAAAPLHYVDDQLLDELLAG
jgi:Restriction endonuclease